MEVYGPLAKAREQFKSLGWCGQVEYISPFPQDKSSFQGMHSIMMEIYYLWSCDALHDFKYWEWENNIQHFSLNVLWHSSYVRMAMHHLTSISHQPWRNEMGILKKQRRILIYAFWLLLTLVFFSRQPKIIVNFSASDAAAVPQHKSFVFF